MIAKENSFSLNNKISKEKRQISLFISFLLLIFYGTFLFHPFPLSSNFNDTGGSIWSIAPPLLALALAIITKNIILSLAVSVFTGSVIVAFLHLDFSFYFIGQGFFRSFYYIGSNIFNYGNFLILLFVLLIMATTSVIVKAGGFQGILNHLFKYAKSKRSLQVFTVLTGLIIFIDDYINTMIVGSGIRPMIRRFGVSKEKLAFLVDATSAPVAGLAFVSTWIGYEAGLFDQMAKTLSINSNGYKMFLDALPYRFYCLFMLLFVFMISFFMVDFGPMKKAEEEAGIKSGRESFQDEPVKDSGSSLEMADNIRVSARTAVIPIAVLFSVLIAGFWIDGAGGFFN